MAMPDTARRYTVDVIPARELSRTWKTVQTLLLGRVVSPLSARGLAGGRVCLEARFAVRRGHG